MRQSQLLHSFLPSNHFAPVLEELDYVFSENGLVAHRAGQVIHQNVRRFGKPIVCHSQLSVDTEQSIKDFLGEAKLKEFLNFTLHYLADLDIPVKRCSGRSMLSHDDDLHNFFLSEAPLSSSVQA